jgi:hypothetical protein
VFLFLFGFHLSKRDSPPPKSVPVIIRQFNGQLLLGTVVHIDSLHLRLSRVSVLEIIGLRAPQLEPISGVKTKISDFFDIPLETIIHWEKAPENLG